MSMTKTSALALLLLAGAMMFAAGSAKADPCTVGGAAVPECQTVSVQLTLKKDQTEGWALYCPSNAYYYWGGWSDSWSSMWHIITENIIEENDNKADFTLTNTRLGNNTVTVTIGCSPVAPWGNGCTGATHEVSDPGCPISNEQNVCEPADNCWLEWDETCVNGTTVSNYFCTQVLFTTMCYTCNG
jgi:hypothetical protein